MFEHCQPMRNHTEQLQEGNGKINLDKGSEQSSSIQLVHPFYTSMPQCGMQGDVFILQLTDANSLQDVRCEDATTTRPWVTSSTVTTDISRLCINL